MPDPAAPDITATDILASSTREVPKPIFIGTADKEAQDRLLKSHEKGARIRELEAQNPNNARNIFEATINLPDYGKSQLESTKKNLGDTPVADQLMPLAAYLEAARISQVNGTKLKDELIKLRVNPTTIKDGVVKLLIDRGRILDKIPDLRDAFSDNGVSSRNQELTQKVYIENLMAQDPLFQTEMANILLSIHEESKAITTNTESDEEKDLKNKLDTFGKNTTAQMESIKKMLAGMNFGGADLDAGQIKDIEDSINAGMSPKSIFLKLENSLVKANGLQEKYPKLSEHILTKSRLAHAEAQIRQKREELGRLGVGKNRDNNRADLLGKEIADLDALVPRYQGQITAQETSMTSTPGYTLVELKKDTDALTNIQSATNSESTLSSFIDDYRENQQKVTEINAQIKALHSGETKEETAENAKKREDLVRRLEGSVDQALANFLTQKFDDHSTRQEIITKTAIKEAEKAGKDWKAEGLKKLKGKMETWSHFDTKDRKFKRDRGEIKKSITELIDRTASGEDGSRMMIAEAIGFNTNIDQLRASVASEILTPGPHIYENLSEEDKIKVDEVVRQRTQEFEEIVDENKENFNKTLFTEFNAVRGFRDKIGRGDLSLTNDEMEILNKQFGPMMEKTLESSSIYQELKRSGIKPDTKTKWALYIAAILGLGIVALTVAPTVVAAGAAVKGAGGALWS